ncbi:MAG: hypothetical protein E7417_02130, partial [Ruminococcaceae bacterium]|nr:hypothetical protein [Oscillospiraceae bacterium]
DMVSPKSGESFTLGSCKVELMTPSGDFSHEVNNTSIITKVTCGERSFLFTGDAEREEEEDILAQGLDISATVLKAGHHGSDTSSTYPFLREVMPEVVVISVGTGNEYGHPHEEVMSRFNDLGAQVYRTDESGHIVIHTDGESLTVSQRKGTKPQPTQFAMEENDAEDAVTGKENINKPEYEVPDDVAPEAQDEVKDEAVNTTESEPKQSQEAEKVSKEEDDSEPEESTEVAAGAVAQTGISQEAEENAIQQTEVKSEGKYIGNKNSKKLHLPTCGSLPKEQNRKYFTNAEEAYGMGYVGCKLCMG